MFSWLFTDGTVAIGVPGVLYRGAAEGKICKHLIANNFVDTVIQLPPEIATRRKQDEYYRDKLLTFKERVA